MLQNGTLAISKYLHTLERNGEVAVFHSLKPDPLFFSKVAWERERNNPGILAKLAKNRLLVGESEDEAAYAVACASMEHSLNKTRILYLMLAQQCNFACSYCPIVRLSQEYGDRLLSSQDALAGLSLWSEIVQGEYEDGDDYYLIFYGGEPLLNKELFKLILEHADEMRDDGRLPKSTRFMLATNGSLLDHELITLCQRYYVLVGVGIDGPKLANRTRITTSGECTTKSTEKLIQHLVRRGVQVGASVTITPLNMEASAYCSEYLSNLGVQNFGFNFLKGRAIQELGLDSDEYYRDASNTILANYRNTDLRVEYQMEKKEAAFRDHSFYPIDCTCYGSQLVIQPNGQITNCPFYRNDMGHVSILGPKFSIRDTEVVRQWRSRLPLYQPSHQSDWSIRLNGGGCAWSACDQKHSCESPDRASKIFADLVMEELIWSKRKEVGLWILPNSE